MRLYPARDVRAAAEKLTKPHIAATTMTSHTALTGVCVYGLIFFHHVEPGRALSLLISKVDIVREWSGTNLEKAKTTREASTPCAAPVTN